VSEQYAIVIFRVDRRSCVLGRSVTAHLRFTRSYRRKLFLAVLQLAGNALILRYTCRCGLLLCLQDPAYEADSLSAAKIPYLICNFDVNVTIVFRGFVSCFSVTVCPAFC
jgi:hypothetical protein